MKKKITILATVAIAAIAVSCAKTETQENRGEGALTLAVDIDRTKSALSPEDLLATANVKIYKGDFTGMVRNYKYAQAPEVIYLPADSYRVDVEAGELANETPAPASWEQKSYKGSAKFNITAGTTQSVQVAANIVNAITKVTFDQSIADSFRDGYSFTIGVNESDASKQLVYTAQKSGSEGYFLLPDIDPELYWSFSGILDKDGSTVTNSGKFTDIEKGKLYKLTPKYTVKEGDLGFELFVDRDVEIFSDIVIFDPVSTGLLKSNAMEIWAGHATVHANVDEGEYNDPSKIKFSFSKDGSVWTTVESTRVAEGSYDGVLTGLQGSTEYTYKLVIDGVEIGAPMKITTDVATQLPNYGYEVTSNCESSKYISFYDSSSSNPLTKTKFWDSGSSASTSVGAGGAICYSSTDVPSGIGSTKSALLQSKYVVIKFAAGNLFTGEFAGLVGTSGGKVNFGRPFTGRPTGVRFWYKYISGKIDYEQSGAPAKKGDWDQCNVKVALGTWSGKKYGGSTSCPIQVNTTDKSTFWDYPALPETIAYKEFAKPANEAATEWTQVTLQLDYINLTTTPTFIVVSCAASRYGDYFTGYSDSQFYIDEFELLYE
ncbi:MAG: PCMD domain-containing protein [Bacteroidales bacterium]|nr:PCMD domain-containing protein [Bacteroidales bacterium]